MIYEKNYGPETLNKEYKEVTFNHCGLKIDEEDAETFIKKSNWIFNNSIIDAIKHYLKIYLPKYICGFMNKLSESNNGEFYLGIGDDGTIYGIPYQNKLIDILPIIDKTIDKYIISNNNTLIKKNITFEIILVTYNKSTKNKMNPYLKKYYKILAQYEQNKKEYNIKFTKWYDEHKKYTQQLINLFNNQPTRNELTTFIKYHNPKSIIIKHINNGFLVKTKTHEEIQIEKDIYDTPYYWICKFKDYMLECTKKLRPIQHYKNKFYNILRPINILSKISMMIPSWMNNNENMNLYIIKIKINKPDDDCDINYIDIYGKKHNCYRTIIDGLPCCMPC
jgi:hypothetical protein